MGCQNVNKAVDKCCNVLNYCVFRLFPIADCKMNKGLGISLSIFNVNVMYWIWHGGRWHEMQYSQRWRCLIHALIITAVQVTSGQCQCLAWHHSVRVRISWMCGHVLRGKHRSLWTEQPVIISNKKNVNNMWPEIWNLDREWFCHLVKTKKKNFGLSHRNETSPLTQGLNYRSACDNSAKFSNKISWVLHRFNGN